LNKVARSMGMSRRHSHYLAKITRFFERNQSLVERL
jgi:hypothetical protein